MITRLIIAAAAIVACGCTTPDDHGHAHGPGGHDHDEAHGHGAHDRESEAVTVWGKQTQLFVEFPLLVAGEESRFAAHLTRLKDHLAIESGIVTVELSAADAPTERFMVDAPTVAGIFRPVVKPERSGVRRVTVRLESASDSEAHDLGEFTVFANREAAKPKPHTESESEISYLLEQQWKVPFRVELATEREIRPNFPAFASLVQPPDAESVVTAPRNGRIVAPDGRFSLIGKPVKRGDVLFQLTTTPQGGADPATLDLAVEQAQIGVASARRDIERLTPLATQGVVPQRRLDEAKSRLANAQAELRRARRQRSSLSQTEGVGGSRDALDVPSPIDGSLADLFVSPGTWVSEGDKLARVVDRERLHLSVGVPESYVGKIGEVSGAWVRIDNVGTPLQVSHDALVSIGTELDPETRTLPVRFRIENDGGELFAGMHARAYLFSDAPKRTVAIPVRAIVDDSGTDVVYVQTGGESFERRAVRAGTRDGDYIEIVDGVAAGEWVVADGAYQVKLASTSTESIGHGHAH